MYLQEPSPSNKETLSWPTPCGTEALSSLSVFLLQVLQDVGTLHTGGESSKRCPWPDGHSVRSRVSRGSLQQKFLLTPAG